MVFAEAASPGPKAARPSAGTQPAGDPERHLLRAEDRLPVEDAAARIPAVEDRLPLLQEVEDGRDLGGHEPRLATNINGATWSGPRAQRRHRGFAVGEDHGRRRRAEGLRRRRTTGA